MVFFQGNGDDALLFAKSIWISGCLATAALLSVSKEHDSWLSCLT
jgi:hypothetical protein